MNTDEQPSTIDVNEYDLYTPESCLAPSGISKYRTQFLKALAEATPEVLQALHDEVLPVVTELGVFDGPDAQRGGTEAILDQHVVSWGKQFNLNDPWLHEAAKLTLHQWHTDPAASNDLLWAGLPDSPTQVLSFSDREMRFEGLAWCVETEDWAQFKKRAAARFRESLDIFRADLEGKVNGLGFKPAPKLRKMDHFKWLALYQVRSYSAREIADQLGLYDITENAILKSVSRTAELIELRLRPSRKGIGTKTRIVVKDGAPKVRHASRLT